MIRAFPKILISLGIVGLTLVPALRISADRPQILAFHRYPHTYAYTYTPLYIGSQPLKIEVKVAGAVDNPGITAAIHVQPRGAGTGMVTRQALRSSVAGDTIFFTGTIPVQPAGIVLDYWIELADTTGHRLGGFGSPEDGLLSVVFAEGAPSGMRIAFDIFLRLAVFFAALILAATVLPGTGRTDSREKEHRQIRLTAILLVIFVLPLSLLISHYMFGRFWTGWSPAVFWPQKGVILAAVYWLFLAVKSRRLITGNQRGIRFTRRRLSPIYPLAGLLIMIAIALTAPA